MFITRVIKCSQLNVAYKRKNKSLKIYSTTKLKIKYNDSSFTKEKGYNYVSFKKSVLVRNKQKNVLPKQIFFAFFKFYLSF